MKAILGKTPWNYPLHALILTFFGFGSTYFYFQTFWRILPCFMTENDKHKGTEIENIEATVKSMAETNVVSRSEKLEMQTFDRTDVSVDAAPDPDTYNYNANSDNNQSMAQLDQPADLRRNTTMFVATRGLNSETIKIMYGNCFFVCVCVFFLEQKYKSKDTKKKTTEF